MTLTEHILTFIENNHKLTVIVYLTGLLAFIASYCHREFEKRDNSSTAVIVAVAVFMSLLWPWLILYRSLIKLIVWAGPD